MSITMNVFVLGAIVIVALTGGFWMGRSVKWMMADTESYIMAEEESGAQPEEDAVIPEEKNHNRLKRNQKRITLNWEIGSPVNGIVRSIDDGFRKEVVIQPEMGVLHAPTSGKIIRLYPMGNSMLLRTDFGVELLLRVGVNGEELHSIYYRTYVVPNEIITKGKKLLEFDMERMCSEGIDTAVSIAVETAGACRDITVVQKSQVKVGEELFVCGSHPV